MPQFGTRQLDIRDQNVAVERVLESTENPRHRYLLQSYLRHRYLESAGRYQEIFAPEMTVEHPVYRFSLIGQPRFTLDGRSQVEAVYQHWTQTDQCVFYVEDDLAGGGLRVGQLDQLQLRVLAGDGPHRTSAPGSSDESNGGSGLISGASSCPARAAVSTSAGSSLISACSASSNSHRSSPIRRHWSS